MRSALIVESDRNTIDYMIDKMKAEADCARAEAASAKEQLALLNKKISLLEAELAEYRS